MVKKQSDFGEMLGVPKLSTGKCVEYLSADSGVVCGNIDLTVPPTSATATPSATTTGAAIVTSTKQESTSPNSDLISKARLNLAPGKLPEPTGQEEICAHLSSTLRASLRVLGHGSGTSVASTSTRVVDDLMNVYVCGVPGVGKTLCVGSVLRTMEQQQNQYDDENEDADAQCDVNANHTSSSSSSCLSLSGDKRRRTKSSSAPSATKRARLERVPECDPPLPPFVVVRLRGPELFKSDVFSAIARQLRLEVGKGGESAARAAVLARFTNQAARQRWAKNRRAPKAGVEEPATILLIDEIDRAPTEAVRELLEISKDARDAAKGQNVAAPLACNLIVVGIANKFTFPEDSSISGAALDRIRTLVFEAYTADQLKAIVRPRLLGLFDEQAITFLAMKVAAGNGDVRGMLLMAEKCMKRLDKPVAETLPLFTVNNLTAVFSESGKGEGG
jgi:Cdc6-like AAA superfamily ATPase